MIRTNRIIIAVGLVIAVAAALAAFGLAIAIGHPNDHTIWFVPIGLVSISCVIQAVRAARRKHRAFLVWYPFLTIGIALYAISDVPAEHLSSVALLAMVAIIGVGSTIGEVQ